MIISLYPIFIPLLVTWCELIHRKKFIALQSYDMKKGKFIYKIVPCTDFSKVKNISGHHKPTQMGCDWCHEATREISEVTVCENCGVVEGENHEASQCAECMGY